MSLVPVFVCLCVLRGIRVFVCVSVPSLSFPVSALVVPSGVQCWGSGTCDCHVD